MTLRSHLLTFLLLLAITALGAFYRFYQLSSFPTGLYWDEASIAYNAYSIWETGTDEHRQPFPFWFKAYGEYKLPVYIYLTSLSIGLFGLTDLVIRLPSALAGTVSIPIIFLITWFLCSHHCHSRWLGLAAAFLFAVSPWSIHFSRAGFEANLALFFILAAILTFYLGKNKHGAWFMLSAFCFFAGISTYNSARIFLPAMGLSFFIIYFSQLKPVKNWLIFTIIFSVIIFSPVLYHQLSPQGFIRAQSTTYFGHQPLTDSLTQLVSQYADHLDPNFLFFQGDQNGRHSTRKLGMLHLYELPLIFIGLFRLKYQPASSRNIILAWLIFAPLPAALTLPSPHALRSLNLLPALNIISAIGFIDSAQFLYRFSRIFKPPLPSLLFIVLSCFCIISIVFHQLLFITEYQIRYAKNTALDWSDGIKEAVQIIRYQGHLYDHIYISDQIPFIYLALYLPIPPQEYQQLPVTDVKLLPSYKHLTYFSEAWRIQPRPDQTVLFIAPSWQQPPPTTTPQLIKMYNGDILFNVWEEHAIN